MLDSTVKRLRNPKLARPRVHVIRGEFSASAYCFGPICKRKRPSRPYTQILGCAARISATPCTRAGGVSNAVHVPPSACHCRAMLWRRKSITGMVAALSEAMPAACRIHGRMKICSGENLSAPPWQRGRPRRRFARWLRSAVAAVRGVRMSPVSSCTPHRAARRRARKRPTPG